MDTSQIGKRAWSYAGVLQQAGLDWLIFGPMTQLDRDHVGERPHPKPARLGLRPDQTSPAQGGESKRLTRS